MKSSAEKSSTTTSKPAPDVQAKSEPFFSKAGSGVFFAPTIQAKLNIGKVGDHHEQEADNMAEKVVNNTGSVQSASQEKTVDKIQRKRLADTVTPFVQRQAEKEEPVQKATKEEEVQAKTIQRQAEKEEPVQKATKEEEVQAKTIQPQAEKEEPVQKAAKEEEVQAKAIQRKTEKEEPVQKAAKEEEVQAKAIQRQAGKEEPVQKAAKEEEAQAKAIQHKTEKEEPVQKAAKEEEVQAKFKAPAIMGLASVESGLKASKGKGSRLFDGIQADMEKGFGADFSSVRIHTGSLAVNMSKHLNALAFTNGNDIYFNEGKYNPAIPDGKILLAHELTHTIQQGAVKPKNAETITASEFEPNPALTNPEQTAAPTTDEATPAAMDQPVPPAETQQIPPSGPTEEGDQAADAETDKAPNSPEEDPQFQEQLQFVEKKGKKQREHQPESVETANTKRAAKAPPNEVEAYSKGRHVGELEQEGSKAPPFSAEKFKIALKERIKAIAPDSLGKMENFKKDGGVDRVKNEVKQNVENEKSNTTGPLEQKNEQPPDSTGIEPKDQAPMPARPQPPSAGQLDATAATPKPKTAGEWEQPAQAQVAKFDEEDLENEVDDEQLKEGHEPDFDNYLGEKQTAKATITENIQAYRSEEQETLAAQQTETGEESKKGLGGFAAFRKQSLEKIDGDQGETISKDEAARNKVSVDLEGIFNNTKAEVERILSAMETAVNEYFDREAISAQTRFVDFVEAEMDAYKDRRYSGVRGKYRKLRDWWKGLPAEANKFYVAGKEQYIREMDLVIDYVANLVVTGLNNAQSEVVNGRVKVTEYLSTLEGDLKKYGEEVAEGIGSKFDTLEGTIASKQEQMIGDLAKRYTDNLQQVNAQIEKWKEANKGMADKIKDLALGIWRTIKSLAKMLWSIVERIGNVVSKIIKAPVRFFKNLVAGISQGFNQFKKNIDKHLKAALFNWLFGTMTKAGIQLPDNFDLKGIFSLILQVLGLGMTAIRARAVKILGEPIVQKLEQVGGLFKILLTDGPGALIQHAMDKVSEMKEKVVTEIKEMVSTEIITAGITFVLGMLTPVGAFIKACKGIYNLIKFFIQRAKDIVALIDAVLNSIEAMIAGKVQVAADKVEDALARFLPLGIGFLASLVGIGGLADKVRKIVDRVRTRVQEKIIDPVIKKAYTLAQKAGKFLGDSKVGKMAKSGTAFVKQKAKEAKEKVAQVGLPSDPNERLKLGMTAAVGAVNRFAGRPVGQKILNPILSGIKLRYGFTLLETKAENGRWVVNGVVNPAATQVTGALTPSTSPPSPGPFDIEWPNALPKDGYFGTNWIAIGTQTLRSRNSRLASGQQRLIREKVIKVNPTLYPSHEAHHVLPLALGGVDTFNVDNVTPQDKSNHQSQHSKLQDQPQLDGKVWQSPSGPVTLTRYLWGRFSTPGHPMGTPYRVSGFK